MIIEYIFGPSVFITEEYPDTSLVYVPGTGESNVYIESIWVASDTGGGGGGVTDHGALTGLSDDDHTQYLTQARGDARYYTESETDTLLAGKANTSHTHIIGDVTGLQTALDGKAASSHTHIIGDVTGLQTALDGKAATSHSHVIADVTGLQTALDGKQAAGSYAAASHTHVIADVTGLQTALDGKANTSHTHIIADVTGLQTALNAKQDTLVSGTNIRTVNSQSLVGSGNITVTGTLLVPGTEMLKALGLSIIAESFNRSRSELTISFSFTDSLSLWAPIHLPASATITGIGFMQAVQGVFTGDNENSIALYTLSGGTFTKVATTANDQNIWKGTANTERRIALTTPYAASAGVLWAVGIYNNSAQTTAPSIGVYPNIVNAAYTSSGFSGGARLGGFVGSQTALTATYASGSVSNTATQAYFFLY